MIKQAYGEEALGRSAVFKWHKRFVEGRDSLEDDEHPGQPRMVRNKLKIQEVGMLVCANCSQTVVEVAAAEISNGTCHKILSDDLNMCCVTQHSVLMQDHDSMSICGDLIDSADTNGVFPTRS
jgi:hypothetical protein